MGSSNYDTPCMFSGGTNITQWCTYQVESTQRVQTSVKSNKSPHHALF